MLTWLPPGRLIQELEFSLKDPARPRTPPGLVPALSPGSGTNLAKGLPQSADPLSKFITMNPHPTVWNLILSLSHKLHLHKCRSPGFAPWVKISRRRKRLPTPVFLPGESHGQRSLAGYSPWGHKESDTTEATEHACTHEDTNGDLLYVPCASCVNRAPHKDQDNRGVGFFEHGSHSFPGSQPSCSRRQASQEVGKSWAGGRAWSAGNQPHPPGHTSPHSQLRT